MKELVDYDWTTIKKDFEIFACVMHFTQSSLQVVTSWNL